MIKFQNGLNLISWIVGDFEQASNVKRTKSKKTKLVEKFIKALKS